MPGASDTLQMQKGGADDRPNDAGHKANRWSLGGVKKECETGGYDGGHEARMTMPVTGRAIR